MSAKDKTEEVLRKIHVYLATAEPYPNSSRRVVVDRQDFLALLKELSLCVGDMMDEYEFTQDSREKADRELRKKGEELKNDAKRDAEDIYAASIIYTDQALREIQVSIDSAQKKLTELFDSTRYELDKQINEAKDNQMELISKMEDLKDTNKYLRLIEDENLRIQKEKERDQKTEAESEQYKTQQEGPKITVNMDYLKKMGMAMPGEEDNDDEDI
jgi:hypothetical protein